MAIWSELKLWDVCDEVFFKSNLRNYEFPVLLHSLSPSVLSCVCWSACTYISISRVSYGLSYVHSYFFFLLRLNNTTYLHFESMDFVFFLFDSAMESLL